MRKKLLVWFFLLGGGYLIVVLSRDLWRILSVKNRIIEAEQQVEELRQRQIRLKQEVEEVKSEEFVEKEARDKLLLAREGEVVVLLPPSGGMENGTHAADSTSSLQAGSGQEWKMEPMRQIRQAHYKQAQGKNGNKEEEESLDNWEKWLRLFVY